MKQLTKCPKCGNQTYQDSQSRCLWPTCLFTPTPQAPKVQNSVPYDLKEGERQRDQALRQVGGHTPESYKAAFERCVADLARQGRDVTSEDVTARVGMPPAPTHPSAVGALMRAAAIRQGLHKVGRVKAQRTNQHATEIAVWGKGP